MKLSIKRAVASTVIGAAALTGVAITSPDAAAAKYGIQDGKYRIVMQAGVLGHQNQPARVRGNHIYLGGSQYRLVKIRNGAYFDAPAGFTRYVFTAAGKGAYSGPIYLAGLQINRSKLVPVR